MIRLLQSSSSRQLVGQGARAAILHAADGGVVVLIGEPDRPAPAVERSLNQRGPSESRQGGCVALSTVIDAPASLVPNPTAWPLCITAYGSCPTFQIFTLLFADVMKYRPSGVNSIPSDRLALSRWFRGT